MNLKIGTLEFVPATENTGILAEPVARMLATLPGVEVVGVSEIDPSVSDTAAFCARYQMGPETAANCVIVEGKRGEERTYAACMILATTRLDVNKKVKELLGVKKVSFAQMETAVEKSGMEFGAITPVGLPADWPIFIDSRVAESAYVIIGSGIRKSKLAVPGAFLATLPNAKVVPDLAYPRE
jgi:prolyl-tRNA editing enzyme YbaK/EbsC (Cys-tRNA(Pro) deacylase)